MYVYLYLRIMYVDALCGQGREEEEKIERQSEGEKKRYNNVVANNLPDRGPPYYINNNKSGPRETHTYLHKS